MPKSSSFVTVVPFGARCRKMFSGFTFKVGAAHAGTAPPPPSRFFHVAPDVERLLLQALEKQPESRPVSAGAFADSLRRAMKELEATPSMATDVELLSAQHPIQSGAPAAAATGTVTITSPGGPGSQLPPTPMPATRLEGAGVAAVADTLPVHSGMGPQAPGGHHAPHHANHAMGQVLGGDQTPGQGPNHGPNQASGHMAGQFPPGQAPAASTPPGPIDRNAPTRIRPASEPNVIVATNDTAVAVSRRPTLRMPDAPGAVALPVRPPEALAATHKRPQRDLATVPMRPRKGNHAVLAIFAAAFVALAMIAGAAVVVLGRHAK